MGQINELTVLVAAWDPFEPVWNNFFKLLNKYWEPECEIVFATNSKEPSIPNVNVVPTQELGWTDKVLVALEHINTEYTFFILDDYFINEPLSTEHIQLHIDFLNEYKANKVMLEYKCKGLKLEQPFSYKGNIVHQLASNSDYLTSTQPSIWKTSYLRDCLQTGWNAWQFEIDGTNRIRGNERGTYLMLRDKKPYWNAIVKGKKVEHGWKELRDKEQLEEFEI